MSWRPDSTYTREEPNSEGKMPLWIARDENIRILQEIINVGEQLQAELAQSRRGTMREIKFRGLDDNGIMRYGRLSQDKPNSTNYYKEYSQRICWENANIPVSNKSLGQFIGQIDKKGTEIYKGDILILPARQKTIIEWVETRFEAVAINPPKGYPSTYIYWNSKSSEVIGNVWEHPERLKNDKRNKQPQIWVDDVVSPDDLG